MGYLIFMYIVIGFYFVIFAVGTTYDYFKQQSLFINIYLIICVVLFWPWIIYKLFKS